MSSVAGVHVRVPASSANIGPGFDSFGLALGRFDEVTASLLPEGLELTAEGEVAIPHDADNLIVQAAARAFAAMGEPLPGLRLHCVNRIPHGGGQGSSAAAIVAGILTARALADRGAERLSDDAVFALATEMEGHPDNVAPVLFGGFTVAWMARGADGVDRPRAIGLAPHPRLRAIVLSADASCLTTAARAALPATIPHGEAAANSARAAVLVHAMTADPTLLYEATEDFLHQRYREAVMPRTAALLHRLRADGYAAVLSGAGPSVLVLGTDLPDVAFFETDGFHAVPMDVPRHGATVDGVEFGAHVPAARP